MRKMWFLGDFVADLAMGGWGVNIADNQWCGVYPSFIVRLSFVIGSFILRDCWGVVGGRAGLK